MKLGSTETLLKTYDYAVANEKRGGKAKTINCSLTVTNKRIFANYDNDNSAQVTQIRMTDIRTVNSGIAVSRNPLWLILAVAVFIFAAFLPLLGKVWNVVVLLSIEAGLLLVAAVFIVLYVKLKGIAFYLELGVDRQFPTGLSVGANNGRLESSSQRSKISQILLKVFLILLVGIGWIILAVMSRSEKGTTTVKIKVNEAIAREMIDEIGSLVVDSQSGGQGVAGSREE